MTISYIKRPADINQRAKLIVDIAIGEIEDTPEHIKDEKAIKRGISGGRRRAEKLSEEERKQIALKAARKRWQKD